MKRIIWGLLLWGIGLAVSPPFPENALGLGYRHPGAGVVVAGMALPFAPLGLESGASLYLAADPDFKDLRGYLNLGVLVFPGLAVGPAFGEVGGFARLDGVKDASGAGLGLSFGLAGGLELDAPLPLALYAQAGPGYLRGFRLAWGVGVRAYPAEALALELGADDRLGLYAALLYLW